ncbi:hypothetical protein [uncultured Streptococcus sp.]|uniref:hypothetical protein n=1 Tax=uncultured Streptococcus sp. TaxID=83427 RepID=UPI002591B180|nr:hypothetical protein [uncultured Streptococcus sp.]
MTDKERLHIKLLIFSLKRTKEFILSQYDDVLAVQMSISGQEDFYMLTFCFRSLEPDFLGETIINPELKACYRKLIQKMKLLTTSKSLYNFAKNDIDDYILKVSSCLEKD